MSTTTDGATRAARDRAIQRATDAAYDLLAPHFRACAEARAAYLAAVDRIVASRLPAHARSLLDVGAGDGQRASALARRSGLETVVLAEPSAALRVRCLEQPVSEVWDARAEELPSGRRFDVLLCLWNVLGHVPSPEARRAALARMRALLNAEGVLFLDVHNRYNARAYGVLRTLARWLFDPLRPAEHRGDVVVRWALGATTVRLRGHVFTPREIEGLLGETGLTIRRRFVVDYRTGALRGRAWEGQLLYELVPSAAGAGSG